MTSREDIRVIVSIDFGTTFSGYGYAHSIIEDLKDIVIENKWVGHVGFKTPTIIKYQDGSVEWGSLAVPKKKSDNQSKPLELFKLCLLEEPSMEPPKLPNYKIVIKDYLEKLGEMIKESINSTWQELDFYQQVLIVLTIPTEFNDEAIETMRYCAYKAKLIQKEDSRNLIFITEPEAAAIHCLNFVDEIRNLKRGELFMVVDCGGGTVDLICHEKLANDRIGEITEPKGGNCGSSFVDKKFIEFLGDKLGKSTIELLEKNHYGILYLMVQEFCKEVKIPFTGQKSDFRRYEFDLEDYNRLKSPLTLKGIIKEGKEKQQLIKDDWMIFIEFDDVKKMFDSFITRIILLIKEQLKQLQNKNKKCSAMMLVGGFSESKYLQKRIKTEFEKPDLIISVPQKPITAVMKGGVIFGLNLKSVVKRVLKRTYGTNVIRKSRLGDPPSEMLPNGNTIVFEVLARRGDEIPVNDVVVKRFKVSPLVQRRVNFDMYVTEEFDAKFCNDPGVSLLRHLEIELPEMPEKDDDDDDDDYYDDIIISLILTFGTVEILATAKNQETGEIYRINQKSGVKIRI
ncbi:hypothetical protein C1645_827645 [Glomus cerebriforme]|uniref:Actin-like ATPase domain-containing protein n=1 Tax=Glomus cerebriforme TaxID=658196 RepID=A0A397SSG5_9GLOM|nr:hypothetical protein C1645_827645 [Glomus cerebriforme]